MGETPNGLSRSPPSRPLQPQRLRQENRHLSARERTVRAEVAVAAARRDAGRVQRLDELKLRARRRHVVEVRRERRRADLQTVVEVDSGDRLRAVGIRDVRSDDELVVVVVDVIVESGEVQDLEFAAPVVAVAEDRQGQLGDVGAVVVRVVEIDRRGVQRIRFTSAPLG